MKPPVLTLTPNVILGTIALGLGGVTFLAGDSFRATPPSFNTGELVSMIEQERDHVTPSELAAMIAGGKTRTLIIDLRSPEEFERMHVPGAANMSLTALINARLPSEGLIVLYSGGGIHAEQAMLLLWFEGIRNVRTILGGFRGWESEVLQANQVPDAGPGRHRNAADTPRDMNGAGSLAAPPGDDSTQTKQVQKERERMQGEC